MSRCDCNSCEEDRAKERAYYKQVQERIRKGLARIGAAVALWAAMASASKAAIAYAAGASEAKGKAHTRLEALWRNAQPPWGAALPVRKVLGPKGKTSVPREKIKKAVQEVVSKRKSK